MSRNKILLDNINIIQRNLTSLKDIVTRSDVNNGQLKMISVYLDVSNDYVNKSIDILDDKKYKEMLIELEI
jgi:hypothetical protein